MDKSSIPPIARRSGAKCLTQHVGPLVAGYAPVRIASPIDFAALAMSAGLVGAMSAALFAGCSSSSGASGTAGDTGTPPPPGGDPRGARRAIYMGAPSLIEGVFPREGAPKK